MWIGQYRLTSRLATGGMAEVYVGRQISPDGQFGPMVAVKRLLPHLIKDSAIVRMFLNEARITAQIRHPNVVTIFELGQVEGEPFIAMELLEGRTWAELRQRAADNGKRMPAGVALRVLTEACRGLDAAHRAVDEEGKPLALVHRDFTPDNIHVGVRGDIKVIDFGIARTSAWGAGTEPGTLKGKFFYMSPEMITAKPVDHRADIFAAGVMLYEQLCGRRPFTGNSIDEVVIRIAREEPALPSSYDPAVPRALEAICLRAIAKEPRSRHQSLAEFVEAMEAVGGDSVLATHQEVADYVTALFPEKTDERRSTLRRAREADPSVPGVMAPVTPGQGLDATLPAPNPPHLAAPPPPAPAPVKVKANDGKRSPLPLILGVVAIIGVGIAAFFGLKGPQLSASEQLAKAEQSKGSDRVSGLVQLATLPDSTDTQLARAGALLTEAREWEGVLSLVDGWLLKNPKSLDARLLEAKASVQTRKGKRAETAVREAAVLAPNDARPDAVLAELRELQADTSAALESWTRAVNKAPGNTQYLARQGYWLSQSGRLDEAEVALTKANKKRSDWLTTAELGFVKYRKEQKEEAMRLLRSVVKEKPDLLEGHYYLATVLFQKNDLTAARAEYLAADALAGTDTRPLTALCEMEQMQQTSELAAVQKKIRERFPKEAEALLVKCAASAPSP
ncbi:MAG: protein kinase [Archangium sp.]|nr:protein kinase [Archangium sp.]MDP3154873.1 protein kinase [Archangium sp.]MDP3575992.1 protein kinase [Archangium sp.]